MLILSNKFVSMFSMWNRTLAKQLIEEKGLTKRFIAKSLGLELSTFNQYLYGSNGKPAREKLLKLASLLETDIALLECSSLKVG
jgi:transcriptional regulator with XRE-family HTH domain